MQCITLTQPWATLVVIGAKRLETRSWATSHRGPLAIHAGKTFPPQARALCSREPFRPILAQAGCLDWRDLPTGKIVGLVELVRCTRVEELPDVPELQRALGDFGPGRWAWELSNPHSLPTPLPCRGRLGLFFIPDDLLVPPT